MDTLRTNLAQTGFVAAQTCRRTWQLVAFLLLASVSVQPVRAEDDRSRTLGEMLDRVAFAALFAEASLDQVLNEESPPSASDKPVADNETDDVEEAGEEELPEREDIDQLLDDLTDEDEANDEDDEQDEAATRDRSLAQRLSRLKEPVTEITIGNRPNGNVPEDRAAQFAADESALMVTANGAGPPPPQRYTVGFSHRPLYFEQRNLERCGQSYGGWQNGVSGVQFLWTTMWLPYHLARQRPDCPIPARGDCLTCQSYPTDIDPIRCDRHAFLTEAATIAGFSFLLL